MPSPFNRPPLMIIGDSVAQGCRSLTVSRDFCAQGYGPIAARLGLGAELGTADHRRPVLLDLEDMVGDPVFQAAPAALGGIRQNYADWLAGFAAKGRKTNSRDGAAWFDNLAVAGFRLEDTLGRAAIPWDDERDAQGRVTSALGTAGLGTPDLADAFLARFPELDPFVKEQRAALGSLHIAVNARFVLNPSNDPQYRTWTQLDWVRARQPQNLILHVGHNNGLYPIGSRGDLSKWEVNWSNPGATAPGVYREILQRLVAELPDTRILVVGLPKVGAVANLMPDTPLGRLPDDPAYFRHYETYFPSVNSVEGADVRWADQQIATANAGIAALVAELDAGRGRLAYFDMYAFFAGYDFKNTEDKKRQISIGRWTIDNRYVAGKQQRIPGSPRHRTGPAVEVVFASGGLQSVDGMHPSAVGYALMGLELAALLRGAPVAQATARATLNAAVRDERLVQLFPRSLPVLLDLLRRFRDQGDAPVAGAGDDMALAASVVRLQRGLA